MSDTEALIATVTTLRFGRERKTHGYRLAIEGKDVKILTRCGLRTDDLEFTMTHGIVSCEACGVAS